MLFSSILIALLGYLLLAFTGITDKFLVSKVVKAPVAYAFYTAITGPISLALLIFHPQFLGPLDMSVALLAGASFIVGIYFSYSAIGETSVSRVVPIQAGLVPLFSFMFSFAILGERLNTQGVWGFVFLVAGSILISLRLQKQGLNFKGLFHASLSALFFAMTSVLTKYVFVHSGSYLTGLIWPPLGFLIPILPILAFKKNREAIFNAPKEAGVKNVALYYSSRAAGTVGGYLQKYAVFLGSVTLVNALQGSQFVFLLLLTSFLSLFFPKVLKEKITAEIVTLKLVAIALISCGLLLLLFK